MRKGLIYVLLALGISQMAFAQQEGNKAGEQVQPNQQSSPPAVSLDPGSVDFGDQVTKTAGKPQRVTLTNTGGGKLYINSVVINGDDQQEFAISADKCTGATIEAGKSCVMDVIFTPTTNERRKASLAFKDNAGDSPQRVTLTGTGINSANVPPGKGKPY
jgi:hypothetical protein